MAEAGRSALVLTVSDRTSAGLRADASGDAVTARLVGLGFEVERALVPDEAGMISAALVEAAARHRLVITTGGTGLTPRDVTPQATLAVLDYAVPGIAETMRAAGRERTPMAILSRSVAGVRGGSLIINLPGSPTGADESLSFVEDVLVHALDTLGGPFDHGTRETRSR